jgi:gamma-glutamylcyclotransferase (GGCT)/AIG2-like uncharacterized protein YtfP
MNKVCVYGSLRKGMYNYVLMQNTIYLGDSEVQGATLYDMGSFPRIALDHGETSVKAEVYEVTEEQLTLLDRLEGYKSPTADNFYDRAVVNTPYGQAYIYHIDGVNTEPVVECGDWVQYLYGVAA